MYEHMAIPKCMFLMEFYEYNICHALRLPVVRLHEI